MGNVKNQRLDMVHHASCVENVLKMKKNEQSVHEKAMLLCLALPNSSTRAFHPYYYYPARESNGDYRRIFLTLAAQLTIKQCSLSLSLRML